MRFSTDFTSATPISQGVEDVELEASEVMLKLPLDIFLDILSRLPIGPLAVCRCVCKTWRKTIHHPRFLSLHDSKVIERQNASDCDGSTGLVLHTICTGKEFYVLEHDFGDRWDGVTMVKPLFNPPDFKFDVVGSCNGLICLSELYFDEPICVCNPVTGEYLKIPKSSTQSRYGIVAAFAYDQVGKQYKIIRMTFDSIYRESQWNACLKLEAEIYTLGSGRWRKLGDVPYPLRSGTSKPFVNGALHWLTEDSVGLSASELILSFDVSTEEFRLVPPPPEVSGISKCDLGDLRKCLCVFDYTSNDRFEIWVLKDYGIIGSWTKEYIISRQELGLDKLYIHPLKVLRNGKILLVYNNEDLVCYDPKRRSVSVRPLGIHALPCKFKAITHVGSFVSLRNIVGPSTSSSIIKRRWYRTLYPIPLHNPELNIKDWILDHEVQQFAALLDSEVPFYDLESDW